MSYTQEQPHPAAAYYEGPTSGPAPARDLSALGVLAFVTAALATLCTCVSALVLVRAVHVRLVGGPDAVDWSLGVYYAATGVGLLSLVAGWVTGSMWLRQARINAEALDPDAHHARRAGWAWGGWVTPVVALWFPFQVVRDVRRALSPLESSALVACWWVLFVAAEIGLRASLNLQSDAVVRFENVATAQQMSAITAAVMVAALAGWAQVLRVITVEQHQRMYGRV